MINTYIFKANNIYKIGKSKDVLKRLKTAQTYNPDIELVCIFNKDIESELHKCLESLHYKYEWFNLNPELIKSLINLYKDGK